MSHPRCTSNLLTNQMGNPVKLKAMPRKPTTRLNDDVEEEDLEDEGFKLISAGEYIVGIRNACIYRYNSQTNDWNLIMDVLDTLTDNYGCWSPLLFVEKDTNRLYVSCDSSGMMIIDLNNGSIIQRGPATEFTEMEYRCYGQPMVKVDDIFHTVCLTDHCGAFQHDVWNRTDQKWEENKDIEDLSGFQKWKYGQMFQFEDVETMSLIHVPSQNIILLFCSLGLDPQYHNVGLWRYHLEKRQWTRVEGIEFDFHSGGVLTQDEKYVVIVGGNELYVDDENGYEHRVENQDDIFVLDIQNKAEYKLWGTSIRFPRPHGEESESTYIAINGAVSTRDSNSILLTSGWVRKLFASDLFDEMLFPPLVIVELIEEYRQNEETIHWIATETTRSEKPWKEISREENHYAVPLRQILSSMSERAHQTEVEGSNYWTDVCKKCGEDKDFCICKRL